MTERPYQKLIAWKEAYALCLSIYNATRKFPSYERFGLMAQLRDASSSVPINLAEGNAKHSPKDRARFFDISLGSLSEVHCECLLARDLQYLSQEDFQILEDSIHRVSYLITKLRNSIVTSAPRSPRFR